MEKHSHLVKKLQMFILLLLALLFAATTGSVYATSPIAGNTAEFADSGQSLGSEASLDIALGDLNGDGDLDAFVANHHGNPNTVWFNDGAGSFTISAQALGNSDSLGIALGDLDGDGDLDAFVANHGGSGGPNTIWKNDGTGVFSLHQTLSVSDFSQDVALGDLDGDGDLDAFVANEFGPSLVWKNDGTGSFTNSGQTLGNSSSESDAVSLGDLDGDGDLDAFVANYGASLAQPDKVWKNNGTGTFTDSGQSLGNSLGTDVALGDLDGDGDLDAFVTNGYNSPNTVWRNDGSGTFSNTGQNLGSYSSSGVVLADVDHDGDLDAFVSNDYDPFNSFLPEPNEVWINSGDGSFNNSGLALGSSHSKGVALGDLDRDGDQDAFVANYNEPNKVWRNDLVHRNAPVKAADQTTLDAAFDGAEWVAAVDIDGDGDLDVLGAAFDANTIAWWENTAGDGSAWTKITIDAAFTGARSVDAADIDGDGDLDILGAAATDDTIAWWENTAGDGSAWTKVTIDTAFTTARNVDAADVDGDGDLDILGTAFGGGPIGWWENTAGNGSAWSTMKPISVNLDGARSVYAVDMDGDGDLDVLGAATWAHTIYWWENTQSYGSVWTVHTVDVVFDQVASVNAADLDRDGDMDILGAANYDSEIAWWENTAGDATTWSMHMVDAAFGLANSVYAVDMEGDGDLDILGAALDDINVLPSGPNASGKEIAWWENSAGNASTWTKHSVVTGLTGAASVFAGDIDGDGDQDVLGAANVADTVAWWRNSGGSAGFAVTDTSIASGFIPDGTEDDVLQVVFTHNGVAADRSLELAYWNLDLLAADCLTPRTSVQVNANLAALRVRLDDGDGIFETDGSDVQVGIVSSGSFSLDGNGTQQVAFTNNDANVQIGGTSSKTYWVSLQAPVDQGQLDICVRVDPDADMLVEGKTPDFSVSIQDSTATMTTNTPTAVLLQSFTATQHGVMPAALVYGAMALALLAAVVWLRRRSSMT